jgi:hypothetical protein
VRRQIGTHGRIKPSTGGGEALPPLVAVHRGAASCPFE